MFRTLLPLFGMAGVLIVCAWLVAGPTGAVLALVGLGLLGLSAPAVPTHTLMRLHGATPLLPAQAPGPYRDLSILAQRANLKAVPRLYRLRTDAPTAFTVGSPEDFAIGISDGLVTLLDERERAGVLAHEVAHVAAGDVTLMRLSDLMRRLTAFICNLGLLALLFAALTVPGTTIPLAAVLLLALAPTGLGMVQLAMSRGREFAADLGAVRLTDDPIGLASALRKLEAAQRWTMQRLFGQFSGIEIPSWLRTHPETAERIARLARIDRDRPYRHPPVGPWQSGTMRHTH